MRANRCTSRTGRAPAPTHGTSQAASTAEFVTSAARQPDLLQTPLPELALAGRSNVGKSSLINALVGRTLARTSAAPGKTRLVNYYRLTPDARAGVPPGGSARVRLRARAPATGAPSTRWRRSISSASRRACGCGRPSPAWCCSWTPGTRGWTRISRPTRGSRRRACALRLVATKVDKLSRAERQRAAAALKQAFGRTR